MKATDTNPHARSEKTKGERLLAWVAQYEGLREATNKNDGEPSRIFMGGRKEAWCAHMLATGCRALGFPLPRDIPPTLKQGNPLASVSFMENVFREKGWLLDIDGDGTPDSDERMLAVLRPGDLVFYTTRGHSDAGPGRHVGLFVSAGAKDHFYDISGNWGHRVGTSRRNINDPQISCFGRIGR